MFLSETSFMQDNGGTLGTSQGLYPDRSCQLADKQANERRVRVKTGD